MEQNSHMIILLIADINAVVGSYGRSCFGLGVIDSEEVANIYHILKAIYEKDMGMDDNIKRAVTVNNSQVTKYDLLPVF
jgi:hypothetical protein